MYATQATCDNLFPFVAANDAESRFVNDFFCNDCEKSWPMEASGIFMSARMSFNKCIWNSFPFKISIAGNLCSVGCQPHRPLYVP